MRIYGGSSEEKPASVDLWVDQFLSFPQNNWLSRIDEEFLSNTANHKGIQDKLPHFYEALELLIDNQSDEWKSFDCDKISEINSVAITLYHALHYHWSLTQKGMLRVKEKFLKGDFGVCPRYMCNNQHLLPKGCQSKSPIYYSYCPRCNDIYESQMSGSTLARAFCYHPKFPQIFLKNYPEFITRDKFEVFEPRPIGFKLDLSKLELFYPHKARQHS